MRTILFDENDEFRDGLVAQLEQETGLEITEAVSLSEAEKETQHLTAGVLIVGPSIPEEVGSGLAKLLSRRSPAIGCILVAEKLSTELLREALRTGYRDVVGPSAEEIVEAIDRAAEFAVSQGLNEPDETDTVEEKLGKVITFFSTKGGVGKTVFATNTAIGLAKEKERNVILLDLDNQFGDVGVMLGLRPERTVTDVIDSIDRLDGEMLGSFLMPHGSGVKALLAPVQHEIAKQISEEQLQRIFDAARAAGEYVIVDTPASFAENMMTVLENTDWVCLVTTLDVPSIKNAQIALQTLSLLNFPQDRIKVILNRADSKVSLSPADVERHLKQQKISVQVPSDRSVPRSVNEGVPLLMEKQKTSINKALGMIVSMVDDLEPREVATSGQGRIDLNEV